MGKILLSDKRKGIKNSAFFCGWSLVRCQCFSCYIILRPRDREMSASSLFKLCNKYHNKLCVLLPAVKTFLTYGLEIYQFVFHLTRETWYLKLYKKKIHFVDKHSKIIYNITCYLSYSFKIDTKLSWSCSIKNGINVEKLLV